MPQRVAITGASGLIGGALSAFLRDRGDEVVRLVRRPPRHPDEVRWDPASRRLDPADLAGVTAVVHLAGAGVGDQRWTPSLPAADPRLPGRRHHDHRHGPGALAAATPRPAGQRRRPSGFYGDRGDEVLTEESGAGTGFLSEVVRAWEAAADPARDGRPVRGHTRTGLVFAPDGGALARMLPLARLGINGPLGSGRQWWPWISLRDTVAGLAHLVDHPEVEGPVNVVGPHPDRQVDIAAELGRADPPTGAAARAGVRHQAGARWLLRRGAHQQACRPRRLDRVGLRPPGPDRRRPRCAGCCPSGPDDAPSAGGRCRRVRPATARRSRPARTASAVPATAGCGCARPDASTTRYAAVSTTASTVADVAVCGDGAAPSAPSAARPRRR